MPLKVAWDCNKILFLSHNSVCVCVCLCVCVLVCGGGGVAIKLNIHEPEVAIIF